MRPVASFTRLSPSRMVMMRLGTPSPWVAAVAATASGGEIIAPSTNDSGQPKPGMNAWAITATMVVVKSTQPIASNDMGRRFALKLGHEVVHAAEYNTGGRKIRNTISGSSVTLGSHGTRPIAMPTNTSRI